MFRQISFTFSLRYIQDSLPVMILKGIQRIEAVHVISNVRTYGGAPAPQLYEPIRCVDRGIYNICCIYKPTAQINCRGGRLSPPALLPIAPSFIVFDRLEMLSRQSVTGSVVQ